MSDAFEILKAPEAFFLIADVFEFDGCRTTISLFEVFVHVLHSVAFCVQGAGGAVIGLIDIQTIVLVQLPVVHLGSRVGLNSNKSQTNNEIRFLYGSNLLLEA